MMCEQIMKTRHNTIGYCILTKGGDLVIGNILDETGKNMLIELTKKM